jgi:hypothetical protein
MKLYSISRIHLFAILSKFDNVKLSQAGELFASGFISDEDAKNILTIWPNSIRKLT